MRCILPALLFALGACTGSATVVVNLKMEFGSQPGNATQGTLIPPFEVRLLDADRDIVVASPGTVTLTIDTNPSGVPATLQGTTQRPLVNGVARFDDLALDVAGAGWIVRASITGLTADDVFSEPFTIRPPLEVIGFNLAPSANGVACNQVLEFTFSGAVASTSVDSESIRIIDLTTLVGEPARGRFLVIGDVVRFEPDIPQAPNLSDAGFLPGTIYAIEIPVAGDAGVKSIAGDELATPWSDAFATLDPAFLPEPGNLADPANHADLPLFFVEEGIRNGASPCPRDALPLNDQDAPQVILTNPMQGDPGVGVIQGTDGGGTTWVRLPPLSIQFSEPVGPWSVNSLDVVLRNTDTSETIGVQFGLTQSRGFARVQILVRNLASPFAIDAVPAGNYELSLAGFSDLAGKPLVSTACVADGTFVLSFATP